MIQHLSHRLQRKIKLLTRWSSAFDQRSFHRLSVATIGGIAAGVIVGILLILLGAFVWRRRLRKRGGAPGSGGETNPPKSAHPYVNFDYGTGPVTPHTPSLPLLSGPTPPASPMVSVTPTETHSEVSSHGDFGLPSANSSVRLVLHTGASQGSAPSSEAGPSELDHGESEVKRESLPPSYPPMMKFGESSYRRNSGQVECNFPSTVGLLMLTQGGPLFPFNRISDPYRTPDQP